MRILSLLPASTDIVNLLGLENSLIGTEKDFSSEISNKLSSKDINRRVSSLIHKGNSLFHIDQKKLKKLNPDLILTQELCSVCAISFTQIKKAARILRDSVQTISLDPESIEDILENILTVGEVTDTRQLAGKVVEKLQKRIMKLESKIKVKTRPRVLVIEWLAPLMVAGHWVPQMVQKAGGEMLVTKSGERSKILTSSQIKKLKPDIVIVAPCGFDIERTLREKSRIPNLKVPTYLVNGDLYLTRPGPKVVDGMEILSEILRPEEFKKKHILNDWQRF